MSQSRARIRKLPALDHMTHVVRNGIPTSHEETGNLHFILNIILSLQIYRKTKHFLKICSVDYESIAYCLTKFC